MPKDQERPRLFKSKPKGGKCSQCKHSPLDFFWDGQGMCSNCGRTFEWGTKYPHLRIEEESPAPGPESIGEETPPPGKEPAPATAPQQPPPQPPQPPQQQTQQPPQPYPQYQQPYPQQYQQPYPQQVPPGYAVPMGPGMGRQMPEKKKIILEKGLTHLIYEEKPIKTYQMFANLIEEGLPGLVISTTYPEKLKKKFGLEQARLIWLSEASSEDAEVVQPKRLDFEITRAILGFMKKNEESAILLDGLEHLILENTFGKVMKFMKRVNDTASIQNTTIVVPINPRSFDEVQLNLLKREFDKGG